MADDRNKGYMRPTISSAAKQRSKTMTDSTRPWVPPGPGPSHNVLAKESQARREAALKPPVPAAPQSTPPVPPPPSEAQRNQAASRIQRTVRGFQAREKADALRVERQQAIHDLLTDDQHRKTKGNFTITRTFNGGATDPTLASKTLFRRKDDADKSFTSYIQYDQFGGPIKRVDLTGADHAGVPTPHVLEFRRVERQTPSGVLHQYAAPENNLPRPAYPAAQ